MTIDLTSIANAVIALIAAIITAFVIPWIRSKTTAAQFEKIKMWVTVAVEAAEQLYTGSGRGAEKKAYVVEFLNSKSGSKSKFYFKDFLELFPDKGPRDVKKILTKLVNEEVLEFWSSGSTTMYGMKGAGKQSAAEGED